MLHQSIQCIDSQSTDILEFLSFINKWCACMHSLHTEHLIIALLIIEHGRGKVLEHVLIGEWTVSLRSRMNLVRTTLNNQYQVPESIHAK